MSHDDGFPGALAHVLVLCSCSFVAGHMSNRTPRKPFDTWQIFFFYSLNMNPRVGRGNFVLVDEDPQAVLEGMIIC